MNRSHIFFSVAALFVILTNLGCGSSNRHLQSITVSPATADAKDFSGGQVQFSAMGNYSAAPMQGPIGSVQWCASSSAGVCTSTTVKPGVTISQAGLAQCDAGSMGTWTINANSPPTQAGNPGGEIGANFAFGSATLTCP